MYLFTENYYFLSGLFFNNQFVISIECTWNRCIEQTRKGATDPADGNLPLNWTKRTSNDGGACRLQAYACVGVVATCRLQIDATFFVKRGRFYWPITIASRLCGLPYGRDFARPATACYFDCGPKTPSIFYDIVVWHRRFPCLSSYKIAINFTGRWPPKFHISRKLWRKTLVSAGASYLLLWKKNGKRKTIFNAMVLIMRCTGRSYRHPAQHFGINGWSEPPLWQDLWLLVEVPIDPNPLSRPM